MDFHMPNPVRSCSLVGQSMRKITLSKGYPKMIVGKLLEENATWLILFTYLHVVVIFS
jgi:hypothetical protein